MAAVLGISAYHGDAAAALVDQVGAACHEGYHSCFFRRVEDQGEAHAVTEQRLATPEQIYAKK